MGENPFIVDGEICKFLGIEPETSDYYRYINKIALNLKLF